MNNVCVFFLHKFIFIIFDYIYMIKYTICNWFCLVANVTMVPLSVLWGFTKGYAIISTSFNVFWKKGKLNWTHTTKAAFNSLKKAMIEACLLALPNFSLPLTWDWLVSVILKQKCSSYCLLQQLILSFSHWTFHLYIMELHEKWSFYSSAANK